ncbi:Cyclin PHO80-like [Phaffia rhodozyma]|uniref:Cyclin PHO80-like n=1 Tax=Phaffia rhodozyma TaxID=264483 RepID=A0A0F7SUB1_PHARH|nr:Cyclin PHO80-like [Phaffia rhodozyma]
MSFFYPVDLTIPPSGPPPAYSLVDKPAVSPVPNPALSPLSPFTSEASSSASSPYGSPSQESLDLDLNDRDRMDLLMNIRTTENDCYQAFKILQKLTCVGGDQVKFPNSITSEDEGSIVRYLHYWTSLTPHPFCVLVYTMHLIEKLQLKYPTLVADSKTIKDTSLRLIFSAFLLATKMSTDNSYHNSSFVDRTSWTLNQINRMETELLGWLSFELYLEPWEFLERAKAFDRIPA